MRWELAASTILSVGVYFLHHHRHLEKASLPFSVAAILGSALAIFLAFRNNSAYNRWWEARTIWGGIVNSSRVLARLIITFTDSHSHQANYDQAGSEQFKREMVYALIAWVHALRLHLRTQYDWHTLQPFLSPSVYQDVVAAHNKPNIIQLYMGRRIYAAMADGTLGGFDSFQMEGQLLALANHQGACERIKNTPLLRQYHFFTKLFLFVFIAVLPFSLIGDFSKMGVPVLMIPISVLISFVFGVMGKVGEVNEDPFENRITDVPMTALCVTIERDAKEMLGETDLPEKIQPVSGFLD
ncbi:MAG: bestrophin family ion channel [Saprospiraceae bacterium]|nr:bestrophin family ion channel [Saprospiraceae bacterium]